MTEFLAICITRPVVKRALVSALIVGTILTIINHSDALLRGDMDGLRLFRIALTIIVPYVVSTVSSTITIREMQKVRS